MLFLAPLILDESVNGRTAECCGYDSIYACPQGVYPCAGTERYIAIALETLEQWRTFAELLPTSEFEDTSYQDEAVRRAHLKTLNTHIAHWTQRQDAFELESRLVNLGIPAAAVLRPLDFYDDPHIEARQFKQVLPHSECGDVVHYGFCTRFSAKQQMVRTAPPCLGEHNEYVMKSLLGLSDDDIRTLTDAGVLA